MSTISPEISQDPVTLPASAPAKHGAPPRESEELAVEVASQWKLMWWKFRKHRLAMIGATIVLLYYFVALFADFFAPVSTDTYLEEYVYAPPQEIHLYREPVFLRPFADTGVWNAIQNVNRYRASGFGAHVYENLFYRERRSRKKIWYRDETRIVPIGLFVQGEPYKLLGILESNIHLIGPLEAGQPFYLLGGEESGRDILSRTLFSSRVSLSVSLVGVFISMALGILLGGISGLAGGWVDNVIQRLIEITMSIPTLPIIIAVAAVVPITWPVLHVYFIITILLAFTGWPGLARVVRGKFLALREEDFVLAARLDGARPRRLIFRHMLPSFYSHLIASLTLALPGMILGETALSFLGVGLRPPVVSWGVQLQVTQDVNVIASYPWMLWPALFVIVIVLAFNFLGDGLRDAADPY